MGIERKTGDNRRGPLPLFFTKRGAARLPVFLCGKKLRRNGRGIDVTA